MKKYKHLSGSIRLALFTKTGAPFANEDSAYIGQDFSFRPCVRKALAGREDAYFAYGVTDKLRGYFASVPVRDAKADVRGA